MRDEAREFKYADSERENELTKRLSHSGFEARGQARSRYHDRLFKQGRPRPDNEQFDEGFDAGYQSRDYAAKSMTRTFVPPFELIGGGYAIQDANGVPLTPREVETLLNAIHNQAREDVASALRECRSALRELTNAWGYHQAEYICEDPGIDEAIANAERLLKGEK